jgi:hypothetical protein
MRWEEDYEWLVDKNLKKKLSFLKALLQHMPGDTEETSAYLSGCLIT